MLITIFFFLLILFSINFLLSSQTFSLEMVVIQFFFFFFSFFLANLLYIDELLWFLELYFRFICFGVVFFSSPSQIVIELKGVSICYINYSRKLPKILSPQQVVSELMVVCSESIEVFIVPTQRGQNKPKRPTHKDECC